MSAQSGRGGRVRIPGEHDYDCRVCRRYAGRVKSRDKAAKHGRIRTRQRRWWTRDVWTQSDSDWVQDRAREISDELRDLWE